VHDIIKQALVQARETDTRLIFRTLRNSARVLLNEISEQVLGLVRRAAGVKFDELRPLVNGQRGRAGLESGDIGHGVIWAGVVAGLDASAFTPTTEPASTTRTAARTMPRICLRIALILLTGFDVTGTAAQRGAMPDLSQPPGDSLETIRRGRCLGPGARRTPGPVGQGRK
jgi:hypothetical protein